MLTSWHSRVPLAADVERIERVVRAYIARIETPNNAALCQAEVCETDDACDPVPRVFAVATRPIPAGAELRCTSACRVVARQLRRARRWRSSPRRPSSAAGERAASVIRSISASRWRRRAQAKAVGLAGAMPRAAPPRTSSRAAGRPLYVDDEENGAAPRAEFASAPACPAEDMYAAGAASSPA